MDLQPVNRRSVPDEVFEQLAAQIVGGGLTPGEALPSERRLAEGLGVSRPAVREAMKRLSQAGLIEIRQGDTTTVRDYRRSAGLDLLPQLLIRGGELDVDVARSVLEVRLILGPSVARLCAERGSSADRVAALEAILSRMRAADDDVELQRLALDLWDLVVDGADNVAFRLMFNALAAAYAPVMDALAVVMQREVRNWEAYGALVVAIADTDGAAAEQAARDVLEPGTHAVLDVIDTLLTS